MSFIRTVLHHHRQPSIQARQFMLDNIKSLLEEQIKACKSTILMVSHDRTLLERVATKIIVIEGSGAWVHGGSYTTFPEARAKRQELLGDAVKRWNDEERRLGAGSFFVFHGHFGLGASARPRCCEPVLQHNRWS